MHRHQLTAQESARPVKVQWQQQGQQQETVVPRGALPRLVEWLLSNNVEYRSIKNV